MLNGFFVLGELLIFASAAAFFLAEKLYAFLPEQYAGLLLENKWYVLIAGIILSILGMVQHVLKKQKAHTAQQPESVHSSNQQTPKSGRLSGDEAQVSLSDSIDWQPLQEGGTNFKTTELVQLASHRVQTKPAKAQQIFAGAFIFFGVVSMFFVLRHIMAADTFSGFVLIPALFSLLFSGIGVAALYYPRPRIFDKHTGWFWRGSPKLFQSSEMQQLACACQLSQIKALQIIDEYISSTDSDGHSSSYHSYELNLVLKDGSRLNVMDHGNKDSIEADASMLAEFLGVPVLVK